MDFIFGLGLTHHVPYMQELGKRGTTATRRVMTTTTPKQKDENSDGDSLLVMARRECSCSQRDYSKTMRHDVTK